MSNFLWAAQGSAYNLLTTELNTLASGSGSAAGPEIDNTTNAYQNGALQFHIASNSLTFTAASYVKVYFLPSNNGSTYPNYTSGSSFKLAEANYLVGSIYVIPAAISAAVVDEWLDNIYIPQGKFKTVLVSSLGSTLPGTLNTLNLYPRPSQL